jgi:ribosome-associated toxin RatA of RatAB toxin-antitoxin module
VAQTEYRDVLAVDKEKLFSVITKYESYPDFVDGCKTVKVERLGPGKARVSYEVSVMSQDIHYTLDHYENLESGQVGWELVDSNLFKKNKGKWEIKPAGTGKTDVVYSIEVEFKVSIPGFILNRLVKGSLPGMVKSFEKKAQNS